MVEHLTDKAPKVTPTFQDVSGKDCENCAKARFNAAHSLGFDDRGNIIDISHQFIWCTDLERFEPITSVCCLWQGTVL